jgi:hypothetical protein
LQFGSANASAEKARNAQATAVANEQDAQRQRQEVITQDRVSKMVSSALSQLEVDPEVSLLLANSDRLPKSVMDNLRAVELTMIIPMAAPTQNKTK